MIHVNPKNHFVEIIAPLTSWQREEKIVQLARWFVCLQDP
jgi:hypothetical protein